MINLENFRTNRFVIYDIEQGANYLFVFTNGFQRVNIPVRPTIVSQNIRYSEFQIRLVEEGEDDQLNGVVHLKYSGNWDYKLYKMSSPSLDPDLGILQDQGQMYLTNPAPEVERIFFISDNEDGETEIFLTSDGFVAECAVWDTFTDVWNTSTLRWGDCN